MDQATNLLPKQSITREISGLSAILLGFIFVVILYSIIKLLQIGQELREVAQIDIPLTEVISEVEVLQLQQHILLEQIRVSENIADAAASHTSLSARFERHAQEIKHQLNRARTLVDKAIDSGQVSDKLHEHQEVLQLLTHFSDDRAAFTSAILHYLAPPTDASGPAPNWSQLETHYQDLDEDIQTLLRKIEYLTEEIAKNTAKHEHEFMLVNIALGISAFAIGIYVTLYIIGRFRRRVRSIQHRLADIDRTLDGNHESDNVSPAASDDELHSLEHNIDHVLNRFESELSSRYEIEERLIALATTDKLTGALNRHKWDETLSNEIELAKRGGALSLVAIDLDHFKSINDTYGHNVGDVVLVKAVELVKGCTRKTDLLFRLGGEEFMLLLRQLDKDSAANAAEKLRAAFTTHSEEGIPEFTASFGVVEFDETESAEDFVRRADQALYESKHNGRNRVTIG